MDRLATLTEETRWVLAAALLCFIFSLLHWVQFTIGGNLTVGSSEWHGIGVAGGLFVVALLLWEAVRAFEVAALLQAVSPPLVSLGLSLGVTLFSVLAFRHFSSGRQWPAWAVLILAIVIGAVALRRARRELVGLRRTRARR